MSARGTTLERSLSGSHADTAVAGTVQCPMEVDHRRELRSTRAGPRNSAHREERFGLFAGEGEVGRVAKLTGDALHLDRRGA